MADGDDWGGEDGLSIVLTPLQLAAILDADHISPHEMLVNRLWATGGLVVSGLQLVGAGALLLTPEPTMATKAGGVVLGLHGLDQGQAAARQLWTGESTKDFTQMAGEAAARQFGADRKTAFWAGVGLDVAVPLVVSAGLGAARLSAIRAGRISLAEEELAGGHTVERHIAKDETYLRGRLANPKFKGKAASTFPSLEVAEDVVSKAIKAHDAEIRAWATTAKQGDVFSKPFDAGRVIGRGILRKTGQFQDMQSIMLRLQRVEQAQKPYFVLTAFPTP